jgi:LDH2 family malate/lactate/ureidoglycolate dehydrogenase
MNQPPEESVIVSEQSLLAFATSCFERAGVPTEHAAIVARLLVNCDLRGVRSHGTRQVNGYCKQFDDGILNPIPKIQIVRETAAVVAVDGDGGLGYVPMVQATEMAITRARDVGLGMATVRGIGHYGSAGHYCRMCMEAGCIGFSVQGSVGHGNASGSPSKPQLAYFGNPPICFALPGKESAGVVLDAATRILADYQNGPEFDALIPVIPAAFFKSVGYTAVAALMGGGLAGVMERSDEARQRWPRARGGGTILAIRIDAAVDEEAFREEVDRMVRDVGETYEPFPGLDRALLPGTIEAERFEQYRRQGVPFGAGEQEQVQEVCMRLDVPLPWADSLGN